MDLIKDQKGGAKTVKIEDLPIEELQRLLFNFPDARKEYVRRFAKSSLGE